MIKYFTMENLSNSSFIGQQEGEKILSIITPQPAVFILEYTKLICVAVLFLIGFISLRQISYIFIIVGIVLSVFTLITGFFLYRSIHSKRVAYITDRRIVRFEPSNAFVVNSRSLTWDNVLKVKTFSTNLFWRLMNVGNAIIHSKTTATSVNDTNQILIGNDDIVLKNVYFYKDLGNYIDKILYLYLHDQDELKNIRPFVAKAKSQRY
jgi:hypothetical protein